MSAFTYASYLRLDGLLGQQRRVSEPVEHDEMLFIIVHQVNELWFKQMLHEGDLLAGAFDRADVPLVRHTLARLCTILKTLVSQVDILETMTPPAFNTFRRHLRSTSGFQSEQFRHLEIFFGTRDVRVLDNYPVGSSAHQALLDRLASPSLYDLFLRHLARQGHPIPPQAWERDLSTSCQPNEAVQQVLVDIYRRDPELSHVCERLVDLDEGFQEWRYRHVQLVQRTIGTKPGTGGSAGAEYLKSTLFRPFFPDLWAIRADL